VRTVFGTLGAIIMAGSLFTMKVRELRTYALVELAFAVILAATTLFRLKNSILFEELLTIGAAIYVMIRGMDNFKKDFDERNAKEKPLEVGSSS